MKLLEIIFSPIVFSIGFLTPLIAQILLACSVASTQMTAYSLGLGIALAFGTVAQIRGSWIWVKS